MSYSTLRESSLYDNFVNDFIEKDFQKWFVDKILIEESIEEEEEAFELEEEEEFVFIKQKRDHYKPPGKSKVDFGQCQWAIFFNDVSVKDPESRLGKVFRRRFRVPFSLFEYLLELTERFNLFGHRRAINNLFIPDKFKLLAILRTLGRGECLDTIEELSGISKSTVQRSLHAWCGNLVKFLKPDFIRNNCYRYRYDNNIYIRDQRYVYIYLKSIIPWNYVEC